MNSFYCEINFSKAADYILRNRFEMNGNHFSDDMFFLNITRNINNDYQKKSTGFYQNVLFGLAGEIFNVDELKKSGATKSDIDLIAELSSLKGFAPLIIWMEILPYS